jgi:hypothetical protein
LYFYLPTTVTQLSGGNYVLSPQIERFVIRDALAQGFYPFNRFTRVELGVHLASISQATLRQDYGCVPGYGCAPLGDPLTVDGPTITHYGPQIALVHDNALFGYVGPFAGARSRFEISPNWGSWRFTSGVADWRRYVFFRPFTLAVRGMFFGRFGRDGDLFPQFLGSTDLVRGYTAGSLINNECLTQPTSTVGQTGCPALDQLIGSRIAVANVELRFPLTRSLVLGFLPVGLPPIEGALFYDMGLAWSSNSAIVWDRAANQQDLERFRAPVKSWGGSIRVNVLGFVVLRFDITKPLSRARDSAYWTVSVGPTF